MKTLVFVSIPGSVLSLELVDFPCGGPVEGRSYEFEGKLYKVTEVIESLGSRGLQGNTISSEMRLLQFADAICQGDEALKQQILKAKRVGKNGPQEQVSSGGIIIPVEEKPSLELGEQIDHLIFVRAVLSDSFRLPRPLRLVANRMDSPVADALLEAVNDSELKPVAGGTDN